ncbi:primosomal protein N' [Crocinitomicaceae bacterium]|nr:primosomal protein N' [Crocinitomicaceae bacterium]
MNERITLFVDVIIPVPIHRAFTYRLPFEMNEFVQIGARVIVPFGKAKLLTGLIVNIHENAPETYQAKYVEHILDDQPIITSNQLKFWKWMATYYMAPIGDVMNAALPSNFKLASETKITLHPDFDIRTPVQDDREIAILDALEVQEVLDLKEISEIVGIKTIQPIIKKMLDKKYILTLESLDHKFVQKTALFVLLTDEFLVEENLSHVLDDWTGKKAKEKQTQAILTLISAGKYQSGRMESVLKKDLEDKGISASTIKTLEKNGVFLIERQVISRVNKEDDENETFREFELSESQSRALSEIKESFETKNVCLLHGVTGSGKTEIYVRLIQEQLILGNQVLFLVPEIALTTQLIKRLQKIFGQQVGVYHSKFNQNERVEIWNSILENNPDNYRIVVGARSCVFLPFQKLGLVIVDEEHESTFKQYEPSPRYNGRDSAMVLGQIHDAKVLLGSATPSMETYANCQNGKFGLVALKERFQGMQMPEILIADLKKEKKQNKNFQFFSNFLIESIKEALDNKEQIILFQNRRGYNPRWQCEVCSWTPHCINCDVSLTYHKQSNSLKCHYCGYLAAPMGSCLKCQSNRLKMIGFGTEKIEDEMGILFPDATTARLDADTTRSKNAYSSILDAFENRQVDILIGTQMVTKGLDFDHVSLVGILDAEDMLNRPDFRAFEKSFQLMTQVSGRAGRKNKRGKVIVQTGQVDHWVIEKVHEYDYEGFFAHELIERKNFMYPPFYKIIELTLKHKKEYILDIAAHKLAEALKVPFKERVLGPEYAIIPRVNNQFIKVIKLRYEKTVSDKSVKEKVQKVLNEFFTHPDNKSVRVSIDVDPI